MGITIDKSLCVGCGNCESSCPNNAVSVNDGFAIVNEFCVMCGLCKDACPVGAITLEKETVTTDLSAFHDVWIFVEQSNGITLDVSYQLLGKGRELADSLACNLIAVVCANQAKNLSELHAYGADKVLVLEHPDFAFPTEVIYAEELSRLIQERKPEILLFGATAFGRSLAPRVAATIQTGLTADCTELEIDAETKLLKQTRPAFGGNLMATIVCPNSRPQMATVRPGVMKAIKTDHTGSIEYCQSKQEHTAAVSVLQYIPEVSAEKISDAEIIVIAGKGIGSKKNMKLVQRLSDLLHAKYGVSRPLVDLGWSDYSHQVGQTGCTVNPKLLISLGVSGAIQHLAGIGGAKKIIAVNTDPDAPIFQVAHYAVQQDCILFVKEMIDQLEAK
jgi:electron transfer flavoprotein alpha subunit